MVNHTCHRLAKFIRICFSNEKFWVDSFMQIGKFPQRNFPVCNYVLSLYAYVIWNVFAIYLPRIIYLARTQNFMKNILFLYLWKSCVRTNNLYPKTFLFYEKYTSRTLYIHLLHIFYIHLFISDIKFCSEQNLNHFYDFIWAWF